MQPDCSPGFLRLDLADQFKVRILAEAMLKSKPENKIFSIS
jgi:hypothetical protein